MHLHKFLYLAVIFITSGLSAQEPLSNNYIRPTAPIRTPYHSNYLVNESRNTDANHYLF